MSGFLAFPAPVLPGHLKSATSQDGPHIYGIIPAAGNASATKIRSIGTLTAATNPLITVGTAGNPGEAALFFSKDGGTNTLGRKLDTVWDDFAGGGAGTYTRLLDDTCSSVSQPEPLDTDGDGVPDRVVIAAANLTNKNVVLYESQNFYPSTFTLRGTIVQKTGTLTSIHVGNIIVRDRTIIVPVFHEDAGGKWLEIYRSDDAGLTFAYSTSIHRHDSNLLAGQIPTAFQVESGNIGIGYVYSGQVRIATITASGQPTGTGWPVTRQVSDGSGTYEKVSAVATNMITFYVFAYKTGTGIIGWSNVSGDPNSATDAALTTLTNVTSTSYDQPGAGLALDGHTVYLMMRKVSDDSIAFSKSKSNATYPSPTEIIDVADALALPMVGNVAGELWCSYVNTTDSGTLDCVATQYWVTADMDPDSGTFNPAMTPYPSAIRRPLMHMGSDNLWLEITGGYAHYGAQWTGDMAYEYAAYRMMSLRPGHPAKSTVDGVEWAGVWDFSVTHPFPFDLALCYAPSIEHMHIQSNDTDSWGSPSVNTTVSFVQETIAAASRTISGYMVTRGAGTWTPHTLKGCYAKLGTGRPKLILDNTTTALILSGDCTADSGDLKILVPRAWAGQTWGFKKYVRVLIEAQLTYQGKYVFPAVVLAQRKDLHARHKSPFVERGAPSQDDRTDSNVIVRQSLSSKTRRRWALEILVPGVELYPELSGQFASLGSRPVAYIPDAANPYDWALCYPPTIISWDGIKPTIGLEEIV